MCESDVVLIRDGENVETNSRCVPTSGKWVSPYDGVAFTDGHKLDIDHFVPLKNAWVVRKTEFPPQMTSELT